MEGVAARGTPPWTGRPQIESRSAPCTAVQSQPCMDTRVHSTAPFPGGL